MTILDEIFARQREVVAAAQRERPLLQVREEAETAEQGLDFIKVLRSAPHKPALIAEVKRASPSKGVMAVDFDPLRLARIYCENGAAAISVLTEERYFLGSLEYLKAISRLHLGLPVLRKDFIFDPYQVYEARAVGADAVLLITACLQDSQLADLHSLIRELSMAALVEVHNRVELERAMKVDPLLVGINNRDLHDFSVRLETTLDLRPLIPAGVCLIAESGIHTPEDTVRLCQAGVDAILVGEALVTAPDVALKVRSLAGR